jgi:hypothetical protein
VAFETNCRSVPVPFAVLSKRVPMSLVPDAGTEPSSKGSGGRLAADFSILPAMRRGAAVAASVASGAVASVALAAPWGSPFRVMAARRRRES